MSFLGPVPTVPEGTTVCGIPAEQFNAMFAQAAQRTTERTTERTTLKVKRHSETATLPERKSALAAGYDLCSDDELTIPPGQRRAIETNISVEIPQTGESSAKVTAMSAIKKTIDKAVRPGSNPTATLPSKSMPPKRKLMKISSFGRRENTFGARGFGGVQLSGYRNKVNIAPGIALYTHTLVNVYFNDIDLVQWKAAVGTVTTDHLDSRFEMKCENQYWRLRWATKSEQVVNQIWSVEAKTSKRVKRSLGRVQTRQWYGRVDGGRNRWKGGAPDDWDDQLVWMGCKEAGNHTGNSKSKIAEWLDDGEAHYCRETAKHWEYRLLQDPGDLKYKNERWYHLNNDWWPKGLFVSDMGRIRTSGKTPSYGSKIGPYRVKSIDGVQWRVHELMGWAFFGHRPSDAHTIDHNDKALDAEGCLSNARSNLLGWADKSQQASTSRNGSVADTLGKPVIVSVEGVETGYTDSISAAAALAVTSGFVSNVCNGTYTSRKFEAWFAPQPNLVHVHSTFANGKLTLTTEVEHWAEIDPDDWREGGKYFCVRGEKKKRGNISDAKPELDKRRKKRKRA